MFKNCAKSFIYSAFFGIVCQWLIELILKGILRIDYSPVTPEFLAMFPSIGIALGTDMILYGLIGLAFCFFMFIYDINRIGFVVQNLIYYLATSLIWMPIVIFIWQIWRYPKALFGVILGFFVTYIVMTIVAYRITKGDVESINHAITKEE